MTGCCAKCKVPFEWYGNPDCGCHAAWLTRPQGAQAYRAREVNYVSDVDVAGALKTRGRT